MSSATATVLAGTSRGVWTTNGDQYEPPTLTLDVRGVRELVMIDHTILAGTNDGIFTSSDLGNTWQASGLAGAQVWQIRSNHEGTLYASTAPAGLYRSLDGGTTWQAVDAFMELAAQAEWCIPIEPPVPASARALIAQGERLRVGIEVGGIALSDDAGESWDMVLPGDNPDLHMMFAHPNHPNTLFASTGYGRLDGIAEMVEGNAGVFRSTDAGMSWEYAWRGVTPRYSRPMCIDPRPPYSLTVAAAPNAFSNHKETAGAGAVLFRSDDQGQSWRNLGDSTHSPSSANFHGLNVDMTNPGGVIVGTDSGEVWRVTSDGQWQSRAAGLPFVLSLLSAA